MTKAREEPLEKESEYESLSQKCIQRGHHRFLEATSAPYSQEDWQYCRDCAKMFPIDCDYMTESQ